jgi:RNA polymerase sigma factor (sigma-70 family)
VSSISERVLGAAVESAVVGESNYGNILALRERHRPGVARYLRYLLRDAAEAEDLAQETFLRAHRELSSLRDPAALASWLYQIATHASIDRLRQRAKGHCLPEDHKTFSRNHNRGSAA